MRFELTPAARQQAAVLLYLNSASSLSGTFARLAVDPALRKAVPPTTVASAESSTGRCGRAAGMWSLLDLADGRRRRCGGCARFASCRGCGGQPNRRRARHREETVCRGPEVAQAKPGIRRHARRRADDPSGCHGPNCQGHALTGCAHFAVAAVVVTLASPPFVGAAQAWVLRPGRCRARLVMQEIDHVGRMRNDGTRAAVGKSLNFGVDVELDYAFTDRLSSPRASRSSSRSSRIRTLLRASSRSPR